MKKRTHSAEKRRQRLMDITLRQISVVHHSAMEDGEVRTIDLKHERWTVLDRYQADVIASRAHPWAIFMAVMTDDKRMHAAATSIDRPMAQHEMVDTLEEEHQRLRDEVKTMIALEGNGVQVHSYGWIATPKPHDIEPDKAERVFAAALKTLRRNAE